MSAQLVCKCYMYIFTNIYVINYTDCYNVNIAHNATVSEVALKLIFRGEVFKSQLEPQCNTIKTIMASISA